MKKSYEKPFVRVEEFFLNDVISASPTTENATQPVGGLPDFEFEIDTSGYIS